MTTILFSIFHGGANLFSIQIAIFSLIAIYSYEESGSIMGSIAYHIFHDTVWFLLVIIGVYYQANGTP